MRWLWQNENDRFSWYSGYVQYSRLRPETIFLETIETIDIWGWTKEETKKKGNLLDINRQPKYLGHRIFGSLPTLGSLPVDILSRHLDITGLAVDAARKQSAFCE